VATECTKAAVKVVAMAPIIICVRKGTNAAGKKAVISSKKGSLKNPMVVPTEPLLMAGTISWRYCINLVTVKPNTKVTVSLLSSPMIRATTPLTLDFLRDSLGGIWL
jgi:hypothetical protein